MPISDETLRVIINDYGGLVATDGELRFIRPGLEAYLEKFKTSVS